MHAFLYWESIWSHTNYIAKIGMFNNIKNCYSLVHFTIPKNIHIVANVIIHIAMLFQCTFLLTEQY